MKGPYSTTDQPAGSEVLPSTASISPAPLINSAQASAPAIADTDSLESQLPLLNIDVDKDPNPPSSGAPFDYDDHYHRLAKPKNGLVRLALAVILLLAGGGFGLTAYVEHLDKQNQAKQPAQANINLPESLTANNQNQTLHINFETLLDKSLTTTGSVLVQNSQTSGFAVQNAGGSNLLVVDTANSKVGIGGAPKAGGAQLQVAGDISTQGTLQANGGSSSLSNQGLVLNGVLVCTATGCTPNASPSLTGIAKLGADQIFTGINQFTSGGNVFAGDGSGLSALNAGNISSGTLSDNRLSANVALLGNNNTFSGANTFSQQIQASGGLDASSYSVNGAPGATVSCSSGQLLSDPVIQNGIITGATCALGNGASVATLQQVYDASTPADIVLSSASGTISVQDASTPLGTNLFQVTDNSGATKYFSVDATGAKVNGNNICTTAGNCVGVSGGAIGGSGAAGTIAKFTGSGFTIGNSILTDNGSTVTVGGTLNATLLQQGGVGVILQNTSFGGGGGDITGTYNNLVIGAGKVDSSKIADGAITNLDINAAAGITYGKLNLNGSVVNADIAAGAGIAYSKLNLSGSIVNGDIAAAAGIAYSKLNLNNSITDSDISSSSHVAFTNAANQTFSGNNTFNNNLTAPGLVSAGAALGIGSSSASLTLTGNYSSTLVANNGSHTTTIGFSGAPTANLVYNFDVTATGGPYTICTSAGNCTGVSGGAIGGGGAAGSIAKFTGSGFTIGNSILTDNGTTVSVAGTLNATTLQQAGEGVVLQNTNFGTSGGDITGTYDNLVIGTGKVTSAKIADGTITNADINVAAGITYSKLNLSGSIQDSDVAAGSHFAFTNADNSFTGNNTFTLNTAGLAVQDAASPLGANLFEVDNNDGSTKYFTVSATTLQFLGNDVCTTAGNCVGVSGGSIGGGGTAGKLAKFTGSGFTIGDSLLSDNGSAISDSGDLNVTGVLGVNTITPTATLTVGSATQTLVLQGDASTKLTAKSGAVTNSLVFATPTVSAKTITIPDASGTVAVSASGPLALDAAGNLTCPSCLTTNGSGGGSGVSALNSLTGSITLAGTSHQIIITPVGNTLTFSTPQDIDTSSTPQFANVNVTGQYEVGGSQISSSNLSNDSDLAKRGSSNTFSAANTVAPTTDVTGLTVKQTTAGTPTADVFDVTDSTGSTKYLQVDSSGNVSASGILDAGTLQQGGEGVLLQNTSFLGDVTGNYNSLSLSKIAGTTLTVSSLASGQFLQYNGTAWVNQSITGDITINSSGVSAIGTGKVTSTNILDGTIAAADLSSALANSIAYLANNQTFTGTNKVQVTNNAAFQVQSAAGAETLFTINTSTRTSGAAGNEIVVGNSTGTDTDTTILVLDSASAAPTTNLASLSGGLFYNTGTNHIDIVENGQVKELCNKTDLGCGSPGTVQTLAGVYSNGSSQSDETISLDSTRNGVLIKDNVSPISGTLFGVQSSTGGTKYLDVTASGISVGGSATVSGSINTSSNVNATGNISLNSTSQSASYLTKKETAGTGGVTSGDVVIMTNDSGVARVVDTTTARDSRVYGVATSTAAASASVAVAISGDITVNADTGAINIGDQLVTSTTSGMVTANNSATTGILGIALTSKGSGSTGTVNVALRPVNGQYNPIFQTSSDSATAFQVQNALGSSIVLDVDTTHTRIGIGLNSPSTELGLAGTGSANGITFGDGGGGSATLYRDGNSGELATSGNLAVGGGLFTVSGNIGAGTNAVPSARLTASSNGTALFLLQGCTGTTTVQSVTFQGISTYSTCSNSTTAFQFQNSSNADILNIDTSTSANLVTNGGFEGGGQAGWAADGSSTLTVASTQQWQGNNALSVATTTAAGDGAKYTGFTLVASTQYTLSLYARVAAGSITDVSIGHQDNTTNGEVDCLSSQTVTTTWTRFNCTFTTDSTINTNYLYIKKTGVSAETFFIDGVQLQTGGSVTPFNAGGALQFGGIINSPTSFQNRSNSTTAFQVQNAAGTANDLVVDTVNNRIGIGAAPANYLLTIGGNTTTNAGGIIFGTDTQADLFRLSAGTLKTDGNFFATGEINATGDIRTDTIDSQAGGTHALTITAQTTSITSQGTTIKTSAAGIASAFQIQDNNSHNVLNVDTLGDHVNFGLASNVTADLVLHNASGSGSITLTPANPSSSNYTITIPAETGTLCTTASTGACNTAGGLSNVAYLSQAQTFTATNTFQNADGVSALVLSDTTASSKKSPLLTFKDNQASPQIISLQKNDVALQVLDNSGAVQDSLGVDGGATYFAISTGNVGIGTSGAGAKLHVVGTATDPASIVTLLVQAKNSQTGDLVDVANSGSTINALKITSSGTTIFKPFTDSATAFQIQPSSSTTPVLDVDTVSGLVGIGTNAPGNALDVRGSGNFQNTSTAELTVQSGSFTKTFVVDTQNNKVGVGAAPSGSGATLQVSGNANIQDTSTPVSGNLFNVQNNAGSVNYFSVSSSILASEVATINLDTANTAHTINIGSGGVGGGPFPQNGILDNFNRGNNSSLGANWAGPIDPTHSGTWQLNSNQALDNHFGGDTDNYRTDISSADSEAYFTIESVTGDYSVWARVQNPNTASASGYIVDWNASGGTIQIYKDVSGTYTAIGSPATVTQATGYMLGITVVGTTITGYVNTGAGWVQEVQTTDSSVTGVGTIGIQASAQNDRLDDFGGGAELGNNNQIVTIGSTNASSSLTLQAGTGNITLSSKGSTIVKPTANSTYAFQIQNASSATLLNVNTLTPANGALVNLVTNGDFESDITAGWAAKGSSSIGQISDAWQGAYSLRVITTAAANDGAAYAYTFSPSTTYTLSMYVDADSGTFSDINIGRQENGSDIDCLTGQTVTTTWKRYVCTFTTGATISGSNIYIKKTGVSAEQIHVDGVQLQVNSTATAFDAGGSLQLNGIINSPVDIQNKADSSAAFQVQNAAGKVLLGVDTAGKLINIDSSAALTFDGGAANEAIFNNSGQLIIGNYAGNVQIQTNNFEIQNTTDFNVNFGMDSNGDALFHNDANAGAAFQIQRAGSGAVLFNVDTTNSVITIGGDSTTFGSLTLSNAHFKSTQTTAPTIGTPASCGSSPSAAVTAGSTDSAGSFTITTGSGSPTTCTVTVQFNKAYGAAPKAIILTPSDSVNSATAAILGNVSTVTAGPPTTFVVKIIGTPAASTKYGFYYWVVE